MATVIDKLENLVPFRSEKQRRYLWKFHPDIAKKWSHKYGSKPQKKTRYKGKRR